MGRKRRTSDQTSLLLDYMAKNQDFANDRYSGAKEEVHQEEWKRLADMLSEKGTPRSVEEWQESWRGIKRMARSNNLEVIKVQSQALNPAPKVIMLQKVLSIIWPEKKHFAEISSPGATLPMDKGAATIKEETKDVPSLPIQPRDSLAVLPKEFTECTINSSYPMLLLCAHLGPLQFLWVFFKGSPSVEPSDLLQEGLVTLIPVDLQKHTCVAKELLQLKSSCLLLIQAASTKGAIRVPSGEVLLYVKPQ